MVKWTGNAGRKTSPPSPTVFGNEPDQQDRYWYWYNNNNNTKKNGEGKENETLAETYHWTKMYSIGIYQNSPCTVPRSFSITMGVKKTKIS